MFWHSILRRKRQVYFDEWQASHQTTLTLSLWFLLTALNHSIRASQVFSETVAGLIDKHTVTRATPHNPTKQKHFSVLTMSRETILRSWSVRLRFNEIMCPKSLSYAFVPLSFKMQVPVIPSETYCSSMDILLSFEALFINYPSPL